MDITSIPWNCRGFDTGSPYFGQAGRLGLRAKRARRGDQASAADPADHPARMRVLEQRPVSAQ